MWGGAADGWRMPFPTQVLRASTDDGVRKMAAVLLRQRVKKVWGKLPDPFRVQFKARMIEQIAAGGNPAVCRAVGRVVR